jgi:hypothetical protein
MLPARGLERVAMTRGSRYSSDATESRSAAQPSRRPPVQDAHKRPGAPRVHLPLRAAAVAVDDRRLRRAVVALGGASYALAVGSIGSREIRDGSIRGVDVKNHSLSGVDLKNDSVGGAAIKEQTLGPVPVAQTALSVEASSTR